MDIVFTFNKVTGNKINENFLTGLRGGINILFSDFKNQFQKLGSCRKFKIAVMYN